MRKALIVGIDHYDNFQSLRGCVNDAHSVKSVLERHADGTINFANPRLLTGTGPGAGVFRETLFEAIRELFAGDSEIALLYFSGHGYIEDTGGYLCGSDAQTGSDGVALEQVMTLAGKSAAKNKVIILDSCHSGSAGDRPLSDSVAEIKDGMTILTASTAEQYAIEANGSGVFTALFVDALGGAAANLVGDVTPGSVYAHIDQSLGPWAQRPVFKTNVKTFVSLRKAEPPIALADLRALAQHFPTPDHRYALDPTYEPERSDEEKRNPKLPVPDPQHTAVFEVLQSYVKVNLARPVGAPHMWHAAMQSQACELTVLGQHYQRLVSKGLI